ncbi:MAG: zeta toxin family protein [Steroidobacteraceae bacterium]
MTTDNPDLLNGLTLDEVLEHWFRYDNRSSKPEFALITGTGVCGKTRLRHEQFAKSHVNVDAGDIFRRLEGDRILDFPGEHREIIDKVGRVIAKTAISGKLNIVTEVHHLELDSHRALIDAMTGAGYKVNVVVLECEWEEAQRRNLARGPHNISAYYTDEFNVKWLVAAAKITGKFGRVYEAGRETT